MNNNDTDLLQKIKDNAFYIALGVGLIAILAVVAIYTMGRNGGTTGGDDMDLNQPFEYSSINDDTWDDSTTGNNTTGRSDRNSGTTDNNVNNRNTQSESESGTITNIPDTNAQQKLMKKNIQVPEESQVTDEAEATSNAVNDTTTVLDGTDDGEQLPVTADTGELNFGSGKTLEWPVKGEVILPFSMETTVYYKTLEQYQTNPGILIAAGSGSTVKSAYLGKVEKVTSDNTYGNMVTVYLGNDYRAVYGQLDTIYVKEGDYIKAGESIGTIGKPTDTFEDEGSHLFFELLSGETPVDPVSFME